MYARHEHAGDPRRCRARKNVRAVVVEPRVIQVGVRVEERRRAFAQFEVPFTGASPLQVILNSARRFCDQAVSVERPSSGRSSP